MTKILMRIAMKRTKNRIRPEIGEEQYSFVQDAGTRNAIFTIRLLAEWVLEMQKDIFICFIDFAKAFDKVKNDHLLDLLQQLNLDGRDLRVIRNLYWEQSACIRIGNDYSKFTKIERFQARVRLLPRSVQPLQWDDYERAKRIRRTDCRRKEHH